MTTKIFLGTDGAEWSAEDNWDPLGSPADGDLAIIGGGSTVDSAFAVLDVPAPSHATIQLGVPDSVVSATLDVDSADLPDSLIIRAFGSSADPGTAAVLPEQTLLVHGATLLNGLLEAEGFDETLIVALSSPNAMHPASFEISSTATVLDAPESGITLTGNGVVENDGVILVEGTLQITSESFASVGGGRLQLQNGGVVTVGQGVAVTSNAQGTGTRPGFDFKDGTGTLRIYDLALFGGDITVSTAGARVELEGIAADHVAYDASTTTLTLFDGMTQVGTLDINDPDGRGMADFAITAPTEPGAPTVVTYAPVAPSIVLRAMPVPVLEAPGQSVDAATLLQQAFGAVPPQWASYALSFESAEYLYNADFSYWNPTPGDTSISQWSVPSETTLAAADIGSVSFLAGNEIGPFVDFTVPVAGPADAPTVYASYQIIMIDPAVASPAVYSGHVTPADIVASALRYAAAYGGVPNDNDCGFIADAVAAAAGASFPQNLLFGDEHGGGFWRVVYSGADQVDPVQNWSTLVQPGDVVKMAWINSGGHHVTTVTGNLGADGLPVFDNGDNDTIHLHDVNYWVATDPASIVIFRLDPNQQFLINGTGQGESIQGSPYNNLIEPGGGAVITAGAGENEIEDTAAHLNGVQVTDFHTGDWFDATDIDPNATRADYDPSSGALNVVVAGSIAAAIALPIGLMNNFVAGPDGNGGTLISDPACFAEGTRLMTPAGPVAVERLAVGDALVTRTGAARAIVWIGRREIDCDAHPRPEAVRPVCVAAHAFAPQVPARPVHLSPDHAVFAEDVLIPVRYLVNGSTVRATDVARVTYFHVETAVHDVVLAEGLPVETYLDTGNRAAFADGEPAFRLHGAFACSELAALWEAAGCAPLQVTGEAVERTWARLARQAEAMAKVAAPPKPQRMADRPDSVVALVAFTTSADKCAEHHISRTTPSKCEQLSSMDACTKVSRVPQPDRTQLRSTPYRIWPETYNRDALYRARRFSLPRY